jgi:hypothetical protein
MATIAIPPRSTGSLPPSYAYGYEGMFVLSESARAARQWSGTSTRLMILLTGCDHEARIKRFGAVAGVAFVSGLGFVCAALMTAWHEIFVTASVASLLLSYSFFAKWINWHRDDSRFLWTLDRVRRSLAYQGDPGPFAPQ